MAHERSARLTSANVFWMSGKATKRIVVSSAEAKTAKEVIARTFQGV